MEGEIKNIINVWSIILASLCYCHFVSSKIPKGKYRFLSLLPIYYLFTILPLHLSSAFTTAITSFFITWLANFKLILFSFNKGPLSSHPPKPLLLFISLASLPIDIKNEKNPSSQNPQNLPLNLATKVLVVAILMSVVYKYKEVINTNIVLVLYCCLVFLCIDLLNNFSSVMVRFIVGLELEQPSNEPYFSTSLQDFWGKRWNLTVTSILRDTVYKPVRSFSAAVAGGTWAPLSAVLATFVVSGLMHELLLYNVTRVAPTWEMAMFFVVNGVGVAAEMGVKRALAGRWRLSWVVSGPLTVGFVVVTSIWLFFPPWMRNGVDVRVIEEFRYFFELMSKEMKLIFL